MDTMTARNFVSLISRTFPLSVVTCEGEYPNVDSPYVGCRIRSTVYDHEENHRLSMHWQGPGNLPDEEITGEVRLVWEKVTWGDGSSESDWAIQDEFETEHLSNIVGWVSWLRGQIPGDDKQTRRSDLTYYHMPNTHRLCWKAAGLSGDADTWDLQQPLQWVRLLNVQYNCPDSPLQYLILFPHPENPDGALMNLKDMVEVLVAPQSLVNDIEDAAVETLRALGHEPVTASPKGWSGTPVRLPIIDEIRLAIENAKMEGKGVSHIFVDGQTYSEIRDHVVSHAMVEEPPPTQPAGQLMLYGVPVALDPNTKPGKFTLNARHFAAAPPRP